MTSGSWQSPIDEGISGYREATVRSAEGLVRRLGVEHITVTFGELFGDSLDTLLKGREAQACSICGILRKKALVVGAERAGATKLATGHNLDDEAQSVLMNVLRGDLMRLVRNSGADSGGRFIPRIKPLMYVQEKEIATYLMVQGIWEDLPECPYAVHALRREVRSMLSGIEYRHPGTMLRLLENKKTVETAFQGRAVGEPVGTCRECGDPCSGETLPALPAPALTRALTYLLRCLPLLSSGYGCRLPSCCCGQTRPRSARSSLPSPPQAWWLPRGRR